MKVGKISNVKERMDSWIHGFLDSWIPGFVAALKIISKFHLSKDECLRSWELKRSKARKKNINDICHWYSDMLRYKERLNLNRNESKIFLKWRSFSFQLENTLILMKYIFPTWNFFNPLETSLFKLKIV